MNLRVRHKGRTIVVKVEGAGTAISLSALKGQVAAQLALHSGLHLDLSLNGTTPLVDEGETLSQHGIVGGDLIHVLLSLGAQAPSAGHILQGGSGASTLPAAQGGQEGSGSQPPLHAQPSSGPWMHNTGTGGGTETACVGSGQAIQTADAAPEDADWLGGVDGGRKEVREGVNRYLLEPVLLRDSVPLLTLPPSLLYAHTLLQPLNPPEALVTLLHVLMSECSFRLKVEAPSSQLGDGRLDGGEVEAWRLGGGGLRLDYTHAQLDEAWATRLVCAPIAHTLVVHGLIGRPGSASHKARLQLKPNDYIQSQASDLLGVLPGVLYKASELPRLSRLFKDQLALPLLQHALIESGQTVRNTLSSCLYELQVYILQFLDARSLSRVAQTCRTLHNVSGEALLWRRLYLCDFGRRDDLSLSQDWRRLFRDKYEQIQRRSLTHRPLPRFHPPPFYVSSPLYPPPTFYSPPFIIGGDYDLRPSFYDPLAGPTDPFSVNLPPPLRPPAQPWPPHRYCEGGQEPMDEIGGPLHPPQPPCGPSLAAPGQRGRASGLGLWL